MAYQLILASKVDAACGHARVTVQPQAVGYCDFNSLGVPGPDEVDGYVGAWSDSRTWEAGDVVELRDYDDEGPVCSASIVERLEGAAPFGARFHVLPGTWRKGNPSIIP